MLAAIAPRIPDRECTIAPSSFDPGGEILAFPRPLERVWTSCATLLASFGCVGVMLQAPLFWQLEQPLFRACKQAGAFIYVNDPQNMPLGAAALESANIDAIIIGAGDANEFAEFLAARARKPKLWVVVHDASQKLPEDLRLDHQGAAIARELHVFPGVPVLVQCAKLAADRSRFFHIANEYICEQRNGETLITSAGTEPFPLWRYALPFTLTETGVCECKAQRFEVSYA